MKAFKFFSIMEYEEEQEYLRSMHREGWKFQHVSWPGIYQFERCESEDVVYQLDYNPEGRKDGRSYTQMFNDCGWEFICDFVGYSYFRKPVSEMNHEEEIFSDDDSKFDMLKRVFQSRMVPMFVIFTLIILPQLFIQLLSGTTYGMIMFGVYLILFGIYSIVFYKAARKYLILRRRR